jgi:hypothetical protein
VNRTSLPTSVEHRVPVEVDLLALGRLDEPVALLREELGHPPVRGRIVDLHETAPLAHVVLQLAARGAEGVADREVEVLVLPMPGRIAFHGDLASGNGQVDADVVDLALLRVLVGRLDHDAAAGDPVEEPLELGRALARLCLGLLPAGHIAEGDLRGELHDVPWRKLRSEASPRGRRLSVVDRAG